MEEFESKEIENLCRLSKLRLKNKEVSILKKELKELRGYLTNLEEIQVPEPYEAIEEGYWMHQNKTPLRKDRIEDFEEGEIMRKNAPKRKGNFVTVPKVIK